MNEALPLIPRSFLGATKVSPANLGRTPLPKRFRVNEVSEQ